MISYRLGMRGITFLCPREAKRRAMTESDEPQQERLKREALDWLSRISLGEATRDDLAALRRWRDTSPAHAAVLARAGQIWQALEAPVADLVRGGAASNRRGFRPSRRAF